jgi:hypothetical protein
MRWINGRLWTTICLLGIAGAGAPASAEETAEQHVRAAVRELDRWLGDDQNAQQWRRFLQLEDLNVQLEQGDRADASVVQRIHAIYAGDNRHLGMRQFAAVRNALREWLDELPPLGREQLLQAARAARQDYVPITESDVRRTRDQLASCLQALDAFLSEGDAETAASWKEYLQWSELEQQLVEGQEPNRRLLTTMHAKFLENEAGLELPEFTRVRDAIDRYADAILFATNSNSETLFENVMEQLATTLEENPDELPTDAGRKIGQSLGWLARFAQQRALATAVQRRLSRPNLFLRFSEDMLRTGVDQAVDQQTGVREVIMGTSIRGNARMQGQVTLDLIPGVNPAQLDVLLTGTTFSNNTGRNRSVTIRSSGVTRVNGRKRLLLDEEGVVGQYAQASCDTDSTIHSISARCAMVRKIASKQASRTKPRVEAIASQRAARRVERDMNAQAAEMLETLNETFQEKFRNPLLRRNGFPQQLDFESTDDSLQVTMLQAGRDLLAAPTDPPPLTADYDIGIRFHETLVGNLSQALVGGITLDDEDAARMVEDLTGSVPDELVITEDSDPWSIQFASQVPVEVRIDDDTFTLSIRGERFTRQDTVVKETMVISASYTVAKTPDGVLLTRQGDIQVSYPKLPSEGVSQGIMKVFMKKKFAALMKPEIKTTGLVLPGRWEKLGALELLQFHCDDGWAALGWNKGAQGDRVALGD